MVNTNFNRLLQESLARSSNESLVEISSLLPKCDIKIIETGNFTRVIWNTYVSILSIKVPVIHCFLFKENKEIILGIAREIYGRQEDQLLTEVSISMMGEENQVIDFSSISTSSNMDEAISDATSAMRQGKYDSAIDRIHTAIMAFFRHQLTDYGIGYRKDDSLTVLYSKLHNNINVNASSGEIEKEIKKALRSATNIIDVLNNARNNHSYAHPNQNILSRNEAELIIQLVKAITDYIDKLNK